MTDLIERLERQLSEERVKGFCKWCGEQQSGQRQHVDSLERQLRAALKAREAGDG